MKHVAAVFCCRKLNPLRLSYISYPGLFGLAGAAPKTFEVHPAVAYIREQHGHSEQRARALSRMNRRAPTALTRGR